MARQTSDKTQHAEQVDEQAQEQAGTGQEPDIRGVHIPGSAPGQYLDQGPVTLPVTPRSA